MHRSKRKSEKCTPSDVHGRQVLLISGLHDQLIDLAIHRQCNGLFRHEPPKLVAHVFQDTSRRIRNIGMSASLERC